MKWMPVKRILRYLRGTTSLILLSVSAQSEAGDKSDAKSVSDAVLELNGMVSAWSSEKQAFTWMSDNWCETTAVMPSHVQFEIHNSEPIARRIMLFCFMAVSSPSGLDSTWRAYT
ncbi:hypothetical protein PHYSODRAFT_324023 [Phytophthora sojae]|uniref:Uncharacterized protein n=1 Tax=Phytophthora sojae (strain P6497) TaxID=1094619 RepID=G4YR20_PHYSP|nr:hypothetical protein PHYSODRAFT_324023 [Phytophthora sojae]EGZ30700.1 hypothetical protein PHYSODRAFT_324023 [Phytophthora sojae]|eukprot:XP_009517975.1 hypothetical protein PHYSODRAFT_324023 [Phytophthora sojae]